MKPDEIRQLIINHQRRLQKLKERRAVDGLSVDPKILIEIEDIKTEIKNLQSKLELVKTGGFLSSVQTESRYSFEDGLMGWEVQVYEGCKACERINHSNNRAKEGQFSLEAIIDLVGGHSQKSKGEIWVNMRDIPPKGNKVPLDFTGHTITAWVYAPQGSKGDSSRPNGFQIFVKDENWKSEYGSWKNVKEDQWILVSLDVNLSKPKDGWMDNGFNPKRVIAIGLKMGAGEGSRAKYKGPIYIDAVDW